MYLMILIAGLIASSAHAEPIQGAHKVTTLTCDQQPLAELGMLMNLEFITAGTFKLNTDWFGMGGGRCVSETTGMILQSAGKVTFLAAGTSFQGDLLAPCRNVLAAFAGRFDVLKNADGSLTLKGPQSLAACPNAHIKLKPVR